MSREIELRGRHLAALAVLVAALGVGGWYFVAGRGKPADRLPAAHPDAAPAPEKIESLDDNVFDRAAPGAAPSRIQVTDERATAGTFEIDLGAFRSRTDAERVRAAAAEQGAPAGVAAGRDGAYRVVAGPFRTAAEADAAARRLAAIPGAAPRVVPPARTP